MAPTIDIARKDFERAKQILGLALVKYSPSQPVIKKDAQKRNLIYVPADFTDGKFDVYVDSARMASCPEVREAGKKLGLKLKNTGKDLLKRNYVGEINQDEARKIALLCDASLIPVELVPYFFRLLSQGANSKIKVFDGNKNELKPEYCERILSDITSISRFYRGEWFENSFSQESDGLHGNRKFSLDSNNNLVGGESYLLDSETLRENRLPGISLDSYFENPTSQGFPRKDIESGAVYHWAPQAERGARFNAYVDGADFNFDASRSDRFSRLGGRLVFSAKK